MAVPDCAPLALSAYFCTLTLPAAMTRLILTRFTLLLSLSAFIAVLFLSVSSASAQLMRTQQRAGFGLIQGDYDGYALHFSTGRDPNFTTNNDWRRRYERNQWRAFANGSEFRSPIVPAQTLTGIYLISHIDNQLQRQISDIVWSKAGFGPVLSESMALDRIAHFLTTSEDPRVEAAREAAGGADSFRSDMELNRMEMMNRDLDLQIRQAIVNRARLPRAAQAEATSLQNRFIQRETDWVSQYYFMRERFNLLDDLAAHFPFNWTGEDRVANRRRDQDSLIQDEDFRRRIEREVRDARTQRTSDMGMGSSSSSSTPFSPSFSSSPSSEYDSSYDDGGGYSSPMMQQPALDPAVLAAIAAREEAQIQEEVERRLEERAEEDVTENENRYRAFRYIVGSYESSEFHFVTLGTIHKYFLDAANAGDPIAQYHLALFLIYLGDIVDPHSTAEENRSDALKWLERARTSDIARQRVAEVERLLADAANREPRRRQDYARRLDTLIQVEEDKIDMYIEVLIRVQERIGNSSSGTGTGGRTRRGGIGSDGMGGAGSSDSGGSGRGGSSSSY